VEIATDIFRPANPRRSPESQATFTVCYGHVIDGEQIVDEVLLTVMRAPNTYTTQDIVEVNCHGGIVPLRYTLELVIRHGARLADPGEFTKRAYYFGRIDLAQAEAVADVINAQTEHSSKAAIAQLSGQLSAAVNGLRDAIMSLLARVEAAVDFPDEQLKLADSSQIGQAIADLHSQIQDLLATAEHGRLLREGLQVAIIGRPNVGKSSLLNALLQSDRAIVTPIPGTTRDVIEESRSIGGIPVRLLDTAGLRATDSVVEAEGVRRSEQAMADADLILLVIDTSRPLTPEDEELLRRTPTPTIIVMNKEDLPTQVDPDTMAACSQAQQVWISARNRTHLAELEQAISEMVWAGGSSDATDTLVTNVRHKTALQYAADALEQAADTVSSGYTEEYIAVDLREAVAHLDEIVGHFIPDQILDQIFAEFCIGK
jgi:tRNA modification GTPase